MAVSIEQFWKLATQAQLLTPEHVQQLQADFAQVRGAAESGNVATLAEWLVAQQAISRYQANVLKAGQAGPFTYGDYRVYDRVETGRLAGVFRAVHVATNQRVCLYFLAGAAAQDAEKFAQVAEAANAAAGVRSPYVARVYHLVDLKNYRFVVFEDLQGESLKAVLGESGLPAAEACRMARQAALGLAQMHEAGQVHGEVRPENLWLNARGNVQLLQFPLHRDVRSGPTTLTSPQLPEAADYLPPETVQGAAPEPRGDVYSLGCTLYRMLCGRPPFAGGDPQQKIARQVDEVPAPAVQVNPQVPRPVSDVVGYMLEKDPAARYQQAANVAEALQPYLDPAAAQPASQNGVSAAYEEWLAQQPVAGSGPAQPAAAPQRLAPQPISAPTSAGPQQPQPAAPAAVAPLAVSPVAVTPAAATPVAVAPVAVAPVAASPAAASPAATGSAPDFPGIAIDGQQSGSTAATSGVVASRRTQRKEGLKNANVIIVCGVLLAGIVAVVLLVMAAQDGEPTADTVATTEDGASPAVHVPQGDGRSAPVAPTTGHVDRGGEDGGAAVRPAAPKETPFNPLDGQEYWSSPTAGEPLDLRWMPSGVQVFLVLRPADILAHPQGQLLLEGQEPHGPALGPLGEFATRRLEQLCGLPLADVQQVIVGLFGSTPGAPPRVAFVMRTAEPLDVDGWRQRVGNPQPGKMDGKNILIGEQFAYYQPDDRTLMGAPAEAIGSLGENTSPFQDAMANGAEAAPLRLEMEALLPASDSDRLFTALMAPGFLFTGAKAMWQGPAERLKEPIEYFLVKRDHPANGVLLSAHMDEDNLFLELRYYGESGVAPLVLAKELDKQLREDLPREVEAYYLSLDNITPHSKEVLYKFPRMIERLAEYTQTGTADGHAVARCYLPVVAANGLSYGTYLCTVELPGAAGSVQAAQPVEQPRTAAEWLAKHKMDLVFPRDNLERTMEMISEEIGIEIKILGGDLQLEGITKNQSFGLDEKDKTVGEILRTVMMKANPDGKLVYVIKKEDGKEVIHITTRAAVANRGDKLPPELERD